MEDQRLTDLPEAGDLADDDLMYVVQDPAADVPMDRKVAVAALRGGVVRSVTEQPAGSVDGVNLAFTLSGTPLAGSLSVFKNGLLQGPDDLAAADGSLTFSPDAAPLPGDSLTAVYLR